MIEAISKAYRAENLSGSCLTAPLRAYNTWFANKIEACEDPCKRTAWEVCRVVSAVFAYLTLGVLALAGIAINLCLIPPEKGYSLWARLQGVPKATQEFCEDIRAKLSIACLGIGKGGFSLSTHASSSTRWYTYRLNQQLSFDIQDVFVDAPLRLAIGAEAVCLPQNEDLSEVRLRRMEPHIVYIQKVIRTLSLKHGWYPERLGVIDKKGRVACVIPLPDHIPIPDLA